MKLTALLPTVALSFVVAATAPGVASGQAQEIQAVRADNTRATEALKARIATVRSRVAAGRRDGKVTRAQATRLDRQVAQVWASMTRLRGTQGFVSAAELASYNRTLGAIDVTLDGYGVPRGYGNDGLTAATGGR